MKILNALLLNGLALGILAVILFRCGEVDDKVVINECAVRELIEARFEITDTINHMSTDTFTYVIENGLVTQSLKNDELFELFHYNERNFIVVTERYSEGVWFVADSFFYENSKLIKLLSFENAGSISGEQYFYWESGVLTSGYESYYIFQPGIGIVHNDSHYDFHYSEGNIIGYDRTFVHNTDPSLVTKKTFQFDDNQNYLEGITFAPHRFLWSYNLENAPYRISANNVTSTIGYNSENQIMHEYARSFNWQNGRVSELVTTIEFIPGVTKYVLSTKLSYDCN